MMQEGLYNQAKPYKTCLFDHCTNHVHDGGWNGMCYMHAEEHYLDRDCEVEDED